MLHLKITELYILCRAFPPLLVWQIWTRASKSHPSSVSQHKRCKKCHRVSRYVLMIFFSIFHDAVVAILRTPDQGSLINSGVTRGLSQCVISWRGPTCRYPEKELRNDSQSGCACPLSILKPEFTRKHSKKRKKQQPTEKEKYIQVADEGGLTGLQPGAPPFRGLQSSSR